MFYKAADDCWYGTQAERLSATEPNLSAKTMQGTYYMTLDGDKALCISDGTGWQTLTNIS